MTQSLLHDKWRQNAQGWCRKMCYYNSTGALLYYVAKHVRNKRTNLIDSVPHTHTLLVKCS